MIEDKLTRDERIRLEALNQSNLSTKVRAEDFRPNSIIERAKTFEAYIRGEEEVPDTRQFG